MLQLNQQLLSQLPHWKSMHQQFLILLHHYQAVKAIGHQY